MIFDSMIKQTETKMETLKKEIANYRKSLSKKDLSVNTRKYIEKNLTKAERRLDDYEKGQLNVK